MGPFDRWPSGGGGFEHFYGFVGGETNQYYPALYEGTTPVEPDQHPGGGLPPDRGPDRPGDRLGPPAEVADARTSRSSCTSRPARPTRRTTCPTEWSDKYKGRFDAGLGRAARGDASRARRSSASSRRTRAHRAARGDPGLGRHARRAEAGAGAADGGLRRLHGAHRPPRRPARSTRSADLGVLDDTLVYYIVGDNGASRRGHRERHLQRGLITFNGANALETPEFLAAKIDEFGTPRAYNHYAVGWAHAMDTPYQWTKQVALALGRDAKRHDRPLAGGDRGQGRDPQPVQPRHRCRRRRSSTPPGCPEPDVRPRRPADAAARPQHGATASPTRTLAEHRETQYFEMFVNRGIYHQGWTAVTRHSVPVDRRRRAAGARRRRLGALRPRATGPRRTTSPPRTRRSCANCSGCS